MKQMRFIWIVLLIFSSRSVFSQELNKGQIHQLTKKIIQTIDENYIIPDLKTRIVNTLESNLKRGKYDSITLKSEFEEAITQDLKNVSDDGHLYLVTKEETATSKKDPKRQMMRSVPDPGAFENLLSYTILDGNIAYLNVPMFGPLEYLKEDLDAYLELSKSADALIIDVRQCPGGSGETTAYLAGGFIAEPTLLTTYHSQEESMESYSAKTKYGVTNQNKEVYVLTSQRTGSAAEGFAFYLQQAGRVKVVGMRSSGAGRSNQFFPIDEDFSLSVSIRTSITPSGKQFQGVGVVPDIITPTENALEQAQIQAYLDLAEKNRSKTETYNELISRISSPKIKLQPGDQTKIKAAVTGYIENFFENNTEEMYKHLHPELAKRGLSRKKNVEGWIFQNMTTEELTAMLQHKKAYPKSTQQNSIEILDIFYNTASVKLKTGYPDLKWIEYILLCRVENEWKITDIIWDYYPQKLKTKTN